MKIKPGAIERLRYALRLRRRPVNRTVRASRSSRQTQDRRSDLIKFLNARLDEDELAAQNAGGETWDFTGANCEVRVRPSGRKQYGDFGRIIAYCRHGSELTDDLALAIHVAHNDPARVLREVAAGRLLLELHWLQVIKAETYPFDSYTGEPIPERYEGDCAVCGWFDPVQGGCLTVRHYAAIYSDHPDYDPAWKPEDPAHR